MNYVLNIHDHSKNNHIFKILSKMNFSTNTKLVTFQLNNSPKKDFKILEQFVKNLDAPVIIVAKGTGSFYGCILNSMFKIPIICFNPCFDLYFNLSTNTQFVEEDAQFIKDNDFKKFDFEQDITCFMSLNDTSVDHLESIKKYPFLKYTENIIIENHDHNFTQLEEDKETVEVFRNLIEFYFLKNLKLN